MMLTVQTSDLQTYNVERNVLLCSISRYEEFKRVCEELHSMREYIVVTNNCVSHNTIYIKDSEGILHTYILTEE